uniref:Uncharacterized protein n=1 Tax=Cucumis melo TaxID=3656 RepID=A0A9I9EDW9_CUCME
MFVMSRIVPANLEEKIARHATIAPQSLSCRRFVWTTARCAVFRSDRSSSPHLIVVSFGQQIVASLHHRFVARSVVFVFVPKSVVFVPRFIVPKSVVFVPRFIVDSLYSDRCIEKAPLYWGITVDGYELYSGIVLISFRMWIFCRALASCVLFQPFLQKFVEEFELPEGTRSEVLSLTFGLYAHDAAEFDIFRSNYVFVFAARVSLKFLRN